MLAIHRHQKGLRQLTQNLKKSLCDKILSLTEITPNEIIILPHDEMLKQVEMEVSHKVKRFVDKRPKV